MNHAHPHFRRHMSMACVLVLSLVTSGVAHGAATSPTVSGPVTGGNDEPVLFGHTSFDLAWVGYSQTEFFIEGTAYSYAPTSTLTTDGKWSIAPSMQEGYKTRVVVNRPIDDRRFNGTVIVEWLNVTGGADASPDWVHAHLELIRRGYAWVGVSAQAVGVNQLKSPGPLPAPGDPIRYASLVHPGDSYSYDMFSQAGQAIRDNAGTILSGLNVKRLIAVGESQSAGRLVTYIDAVHPLVDVYDGYLVHSRNVGGAALSQAPLATVNTPQPTFIRNDLNVPVLVFNTENDTGALLARQADSKTFRLWEVTGTAHFDLYGLSIGATDFGKRETVEEWFNSMRNPPSQPSPNFTCSVPINTGPQTFVLRAAIAHLNRWVAFGLQPPKAPRYETLSLPPTLQYALDANGNVRGGIRTPAVDAPIARLSGLGQTGAQFCALFGTTVPFTEEQLRAQYRTHGRFVLAWSHATLSAAAQGFVLPQDALDLLAVGARSDILR